MEFEAPEGGRVAELIVGEGASDVPVGAVLALLARADEAVETIARPGPAATAEAVPVEVAAEPSLASSQAPIAALAHDAAAEKALATPLARRLAAAQGVSLSAITGTGPRGRIVRDDVIARRAPPSASRSTALALVTPAGPNYGPPEGVPHQAIKLSTMRRTIARRLTESKQTVPHFYLTARCRLDALLKQREDLNASLAARGLKLSVNDVLIKALALAMIAVPEVNVQFAGEEMYRFERVDISMAVAIEGGLITPVLRDVGALSLSAIAQQSKALAERARLGKLAPEDYAGGTASISNLGMFGIDDMFPVINPPQALILGVAAGVEQPWKVDGGVGLATIMAATASFDHRVIDGATAARFMEAFRQLVEDPLRILS
jgi:pyruvate dehydrogenase E2 component (dihydrolipoamide acetyltransferase)